jgi:hypothetical protein
MSLFLDLGTNMFQGQQEFTIKNKLDNNTIVYCYEPNTLVFTPFNISNADII